MAEKVKDRQERATRIYNGLLRAHPEATCALIHENPFQLLVATILSAQCTDERVNMVTPGLFQRYPDPAAFAAAPLEEIEEAVRSTGFYRNKALAIQESSKAIIERFGGSVPETMEDLLTLRGVARKTANVVLGNAYGQNVGVVVDTHVGRLSRRMGLTREKGPERVERDLMKLFPQEQWTMLAHLLIWHGRRFCMARKPDCENCPLSEDCPRAGV